MIPLTHFTDVSHTMQHWDIYRKWNERLFREMYQAYEQGRSQKDPSKGTSIQNLFVSEKVPDYETVVTSISSSFVSNSREFLLCPRLHHLLQLGLKVKFGSSTSTLSH